MDANTLGIHSDEYQEGNGDVVLGPGSGLGHGSTLQSMVPNVLKHCLQYLAFQPLNPVVAAD